MRVIEDPYQFFFHPFSDDHSLGEKIVAAIADLALTLFSGGLFLIPLLYFQWKDRDVKIVPPSTRESTIASDTLSKGKRRGSTVPRPAASGRGSTLSAKALTVKEKQAWQLAQFEKWAASGDWGQIHRAHYDWWMYPISRGSAGQGTTYAVNAKEIAELKADPEFMANYLRGVELGARAWGWDIHASKPVENPTRDQKWQNWGVRLGKMADSLHLFGQEELRASMLEYALQGPLNLENWIWDNLGLSG